MTHEPTFPGPPAPGLPQTQLDQLFDLLSAFIDRLEPDDRTSGLVRLALALAVRVGDMAAIDAALADARAAACAAAAATASPPDRPQERTAP